MRTASESPVTIAPPAVGLNRRVRVNSGAWPLVIERANEMPRGSSFVRHPEFNAREVTMLEKRQGQARAAGIY